MAGLLLLFLMVGMIARAHAMATERPKREDVVERRRLSATLALLAAVVALVVLLTLML